MNQRDDYSYELISAFLDGEVSPDERARVERLVASSAEHRQVLEDLRAVTRGMQRLPGYYLDGEFSQRVSAIARQTSGMAHEADGRTVDPCDTGRDSLVLACRRGLGRDGRGRLSLIAFFLGTGTPIRLGSAGNQRVAQVPDAPADASRDEPTAVDETPLACAPGRDSVGPSATVPLVDQRRRRRLRCHLRHGRSHGLAAVGATDDSIRFCVHRRRGPPGSDGGGGREYDLAVVASPIAREEPGVVGRW